MIERPILLVEDDRVDALTVKRAVKDLNIINPLVIAANGEDALEYLRNPDNQMPAFILLDLNMPRMNGLEFLAIIKEDESLRRIPVIVLTTSGEQRDRVESFDQSVAGYMVKPVQYHDFLETMRSIHIYWEMSLKALD